ncbi:MAG: ABC transporter ATP-binding protein [Atopobiaceae bacterium]|jgi:zinc transport system ATP-binding protein|nr:ABC transporter ATP-binding protein [Atopobiaceae bacterium]MCI2173035.1 ABC transporter ATP-binding protein [Atopobiaceae bacterium]MCI2208128.1 ABC transporter ATP-binding protein [Atopobiaceae bacterium]
MGSLGETLLTCRDLTMSYGDHVVFEHVDFEVKAGERLCIVGENGAGKSTLVKGLLGLMRPTSGAIEWKEGRGHARIGYLPQRTAARDDFPASVREVILSGCLGTCGMRPWYTHEQRERAASTMSLLDIDDLSGETFCSLSGGQRQRVLLARAMCAADGLLLLDEPTASLDPMATKGLYELLRDLNESHGLTEIMVSHDIGPATEQATSILHLAGDRSFFGTPESYRASAAGRLFAEGGRP